MAFLRRLSGLDNSLEAAFDSRRNNFDALRLAAALAVLFGHSFVLAAGSQSPETVDPLSYWLMRLSGFNEAIHELAVDVFFVISGFLIARSFLTRNSPLAFLEARILRIFPAAILCSLLTVLLLAGFSNQPAMEYFGDPGTWRYLMRNSLIWSVEYHLPGLFSGNAYPEVVNGSLWTLPIELRCYLILLAVGLLRILKSRLACNIALAVLAVLYLVPEWSHLVTRDPQKWRLFLFFFTGAGLYVNRRQVPLGLLPAVLLLALYAASAGFERLHALLFVLLVSYLTLAVALARHAPPLDPKRIGDLSYGTYLYAFPVQQALVHLSGNSLDGWQLAALATPATLAFAALSWFAIERRALGWKGQFSRKLRQRRS